MDMEPFSDACGVPIAGIIGLDQIKNFVVEFDLTGKKLRLFRQLPSRVARDCERFEMHLRPAGWSVLGIAAGIGTEDFVIDTGADYSIGLDEGKFDREPDTPFIRDRGLLKLLTMGGKVDGQEGRLQRFTLGSYEHEWVQISSHPGHSVLGTGYLRRYVVVFDFAHKHLYLRPSPLFHATIETDDRSGLSVELYGDQTVVTECLPESPAHVAGIRARDRLLRIDDQALEDWSLRRVREYFQREGETIEITACRGEETFTRKFTLGDYRKRPPAPALPIPEHVPSR
jgi:hypothetical protein